MFYEETKIINELNCIRCNQRLDEPRMLPCGETICSYCHKSIVVENKKYKCLICNKDHFMPEEGLPISKRLLRILTLNSEEVYRSKEVKKFKEQLKEIQEDVNKISFGINNGVDRVKELCIDLKNKVQLRTKEAIEQLNELNKEMITEIENFEKDCIKSYQANQQVNNEFIKSKHELKDYNLKWNEFLKQSDASDENSSEAFAQANESALKTMQELEEFHKKWKEYLKKSDISDLEINEAII